MRIGIDTSRANKDNKTGTEWYSYYIIQELKNMTPDDCQVVLYTNTPLKNDLRLMPKNWREKDLSWPPKYLWTQIRLWWELVIQPPDVLLVPAHTIPFLPIRRKTKIFVTVHDVGFKRFPELYKKVQIWYHDLTMRRIKNRADIIITISDFSKQEIIKLYQVNPEKIRVIYPGYDKEKYHLSGEASEFRLQEIFQKYQIIKPYLLYVGRIERKKNISNLVRAFIEVKRQFPGLRLVLAGEGGNLFEDIKKIIIQEKVEKEIIMTGYITEDDLPEILRGAEIFLFPSLYEGFGLPIVQAMASGVPVVTSDLEPHREVSGGAAALVRPMNHREIAQKIIEILSNNKIKEELVKKGLERAKDFSWEKTARGILEIITKFQ